MNGYYDRFTGLNLDEILEITGTDSAHSDELRRQGAGLKALSDKLDESIGAMASANNGVESTFDGASARALMESMLTLMRRGSEGHQALRAQPDVFFNLSAESNATHRHMLALREEREDWLDRWRRNPADPKVLAKFGGKAGADGMYHAIRDEYDVEARQFMRRTTGGYVDSVKSLQSMQPYDGPRLPREDEANGPRGFRDLTTAGPSLGTRGAVDSEPTLQSAATLVPEATSAQGPAQAQVRQPIMTTDMGMLGAGGPKPPKAKKKDRKDDDKDENRNSLEPATQQTTAPVIGSREGTAAENRETTPVQRHDGLLPPVIGARPGAIGVTGRAAGVPGGGKPTPPPPQVPRRTFTGNVSGVRAVARQYPAEGRIFRGGTTDGGGGQERPAPGYTRQPKAVHGDTDNPNRAVVRNSRAFGAEAAPPPVEPQPFEPTAESSRPSSEREWQTSRPVVAPVIRSRPHVEPEEVEHEPGPFLTHYNLGRER
ncbi:hypothetical protein [Stackebrandtia nassauensis]|uniref:Uncharacterized protein n=1 Tax=Stackebrandtia nassauensis (strain DSM 44728 / CIP 108903 / NRRL B-16338 / NBRC 102104 / LLR-40K-21) TaxID=446470 RepID=D3Q8X7_STANL|nr:hypothetical protein [Stackebrandtia nassauensis]ADD40586.1 hypothetical protein Snas_0875 [Stackebrandtia nassauensis DSM 44728]